MAKVKWFYCHKCKKDTEQSVVTSISHISKVGNEVSVEVDFICAECGRNLYSERKHVQVPTGVARRNW